MINAPQSTLSSVVKSAAKGAIIGSAAYTLLVTSTMYSVYSDAAAPALSYEDVQHKMVLALLGPLNMAAVYTAPIVGGAVGAVIGAGYGCYRSMSQNADTGENVNRREVANRNR